MKAKAVLFNWCPGSFWQNFSISSSRGYIHMATCHVIFLHQQMTSIQPFNLLWLNIYIYIWMIWIVTFQRRYCIHDDSLLILILCGVESMSYTGDTFFLFIYIVIVTWSQETYTGDKKPIYIYIYIYKQTQEKHVIF